MKVFVKCIRVKIFLVFPIVNTKKGLILNKSEIIQLKTKLEEHYVYLVKKHPITKIVLEAIDTLIDMNANDDLIEPWYKSIRGFIKEIEQEIKNIEGDSYDSKRD